LKRLGVAQLGDGLVALPADARTREQLDWIAEEITDHGGDAVVWLGRPAEVTAEAEIIERMTGAVVAEYDALIAEAARLRTAGDDLRARGAARLRRDLHRIQARDYFPTASQDEARRAIEDLTGQAAKAHA
jgi:hypothetical protein